MQMQQASLYVGDLHSGTVETDLLDAFSKMGPIISVHLCRCAHTKKSLCYAYVNFYHHADACKAMACLNYTDLKGKHMRIMWSQRDPLLRKCNVGNLFVKNLDSSVDGTGLLGLFCQFGTVLSCKVAEEDEKSKGFGFVQFDSEESAMAARTALHDTYFLGKKLYVSKFVRKSDRTATGEILKFTNLYVKNLVEDITEDLLHEVFSNFGKVCNVSIMKDGNGKSKGFGFVNFRSPEEASKAVEVMNGAKLGSKILFVGRAQKKAERAEILKTEYKKNKYNSQVEKSKASNLYVRNFNIFINENKLKEVFSGFGRITSVRVMRDNNGRSKGFGFVCFSTPEEAKQALDTLNGASFEGETLSVAIAQRKEDRRKGLQNCFAHSLEQSSYLSNCNVPSQFPLHYPYYHISNCNAPSTQFPSYYPNYHGFPLVQQSILYQHYSTIRYPVAAENYQNNYSSYIPLRQIHLGSIRNTKNWGYQQTFKTYSSSDIDTQDMNLGNYTGLKPGFGKKGGKRSGPFESSFKGVAIRDTTGDLIHPLVNNLQPEFAAKLTGMVLKMNNSEVVKLRNATSSLAKQAEDKVQVLKEANAKTILDGGVRQSLPAA